MKLIDEEYEKSKEKLNASGLQKIIIAIIIIILIMIIGIVAYLQYLQSLNFSLTIDDIPNSDLEQMLIFEENKKIYIPIKEASAILGAVESYNGHYESRTEENNKCYIKTQNEAINFTEGSSKIEILQLNDSGFNKEILETNDVVKKINGTLCASSDMISEACNLSFEYDAEGNSITICTLPYLIESYTTWATDEGYSGISEDYENEKAILDNRLIVKNSNEINYGVIDILNNKVILEPKYEEIKYLDDKMQYLIKTNDKVGIVDDETKTIIPADYEKIQVLNYELELYLVQKNEKFGVLDFNGNEVIDTRYDTIGTETNQYKQPEIKNEYIILNNVIPVQENKKWALFDKKGEQITEFIYDNIGYNKSNNEEMMNMLIIPDYNVLVVNQNKKYGLVDISGKEIFKIVADDIYMTINNDVVNYYISINGEARDAEKYLDKMGVKKAEDKEIN